jgi:hypothetical protein
MGDQRYFILCVLANMFRGQIIVSFLRLGPGLRLWRNMYIGRHLIRLSSPFVTQIILSIQSDMQKERKNQLTEYE